MTHSNEKGNHDDLPDWLKANPCNESYSRDEWVKVGQGIQNEGLPYEMFRDWSAFDPRFSERDCRTVWNSFTKGGGITGSSVIYVLKDHGATPPLQERESPARSGRKPQKTAVELIEQDSETRTANLNLAIRANWNLRNNDAAKALAAPYLAAHVGLSVDDATERGWGVISPSILVGEYAGFASHYRGQNYLCMTGSGAAAYYHVDRLLLDSERYPGWLNWGNREYSERMLTKVPNPKGLRKPETVNPNALESRIVFVVEGLQDQAALQSIGIEAVALLGTSNNATVNALIESESVKAVVLMLDNDQAGKGGTTKLTQALQGRKPCVSFPWRGADPKDAGEWNATDSEGLRDAVDEQIERAESAIKAHEEAAKETGADRPQQKSYTPSVRGNPTAVDIYSWLKDAYGSVFWWEVNSKKVFIARSDGTPLQRREFDMETDFGDVVFECQAAFASDTKDKNVRLGIEHLAKEQPFNPLQSILDSLPGVSYGNGTIVFTEKDGTKTELEPLAPKYQQSVFGDDYPVDENTPGIAGFTLMEVLGGTPSALTNFAERAHMAGVILRANEPGAEYPYCLSLRGRQGIGKDAWVYATAIDNSLAYLGDYSKMLNEPAKESANAAGKLVIDYQEMSAPNTKRNIDKAKGFITRSVDTVKYVYKNETQIKRSFVIAITSNNYDLLNDPTGNRRYLIVECRETRNLKEDGYGVGETQELVRYALAEMYHLYKQMGRQAFSEKFLTRPAIVVKQMEKQRERYSADNPIYDTITDYLNDNAPELVNVESAARESGLYSQDEWERYKHNGRETRKIAAAIEQHPAYEYDGSRPEVKIGGVNYGRKRKTWRKRKEYTPDSKED